MVEVAELPVHVQVLEQAASAGNLRLKLDFEGGIELGSEQAAYQSGFCASSFLFSSVLMLLSYHLF